MRILWLPCGIHGSIVFGKLIGTGCNLQRKIGNTYCVSFRSLVYGVSLSSWISFGKMYHRSSHLNKKSWIKGKSVSKINKGRGVNTQKEYKWSDKGIYCYILWYSKQKVLIPTLMDFYLPMKDCMKLFNSSKREILFMDICHLIILQK